MAPLRLVGLADHCRHLTEAAERTQEPEVGLLGPSDEATPPPSRGPQGVEPPVIADPVRGVTLDRVATEITERSPRVEEPRRRGHHVGDRRPPFAGRERECGGET